MRRLRKRRRLTAHDGGRSDMSRRLDDLRRRWGRSHDERHLIDWAVGDLWGWWCTRDWGDLRLRWRFVVVVVIIRVRLVALFIVVIVTV